MVAIAFQEHRLEFTPGMCGTHDLASPNRDILTGILSDELIAVLQKKV
ncbi:MAG: hypothetical protein JNK74_20115 [Candidatus Hydrogenedentes bacterium]|nr:hypothetical protein [Candidatus Hydrogenedentota bacterium]